MSNRCPRCYRKGVKFPMKLRDVPELRKYPRFRFKSNRKSVWLCGDCYKEIQNGQGRNTENLLSSEIQTE